MKSNQTGASTITIAALLITLSSCSMFYWIGISKLNIQIARNAQNHIVASASASSGLQDTIGQLHHEPVNQHIRDIRVTDTAINYHATSFTKPIEKVSPGSFGVTIISKGEQTDSKITQTHSESVMVLPLLKQLPVAPLMVAGHVSELSKLTLVANPNASGPNIPLSFWTSHKLREQDGQPNSCHIYEFTNKLCSQSYLSNATYRGIDIVDNSSSFPTDLIGYLTQYSTRDWQKLKDEMSALRVGCDGINTNPSTTFWIVGDCEVSMGSTIGSEQKPRLLIIKNGNLVLHKDTLIVGLIILFDQPTNHQKIDIVGSQNATIKGALITTKDASFNQSPLNVVFSANILQTLARHPSLQKPVPVLSSWRDH